MARTVVNVGINLTTTYTVPTGKIFIFAAHLAHGNSSAAASVSINGVVAGRLTIDAATASATSLKPLVAKAGDIISAEGSTTGLTGILASLSGFLYDV